MANCGNFMEYAGSKCGIDAGYGKMLLIFKEKYRVPTGTVLDHTLINSLISNGTILGVVRNWITVVGAPVAEIAVERVGSSEMKIIKQEIAADTFTFEANMVNRLVLSKLVAGGTFEGMLVDDLGNAFGENCINHSGVIETMQLNFSGKVTSSFQSDNTAEKTISVTVRYLLKNLDVALVGIETELIETKKVLQASLYSIDTMTATSLVFKLLVKDLSTGKPYAGSIASGDVSVLGAKYATLTSTVSAYVPATGLLTITLTGTGMLTTAQKLNVSITNALAYMGETAYTVLLGE